MKSKTMQISIRACTFAILGLFLLAGIWACQKELDFTNSNVSKATLSASQVTAINQAKSWFESQRQLPNVKDDNVLLKKIEPIWGNAVSTGKTVEMPYAINKNIIVPSLYETGLSNKGRARLVIFDNGKEKVAKVWHFMPNESYKGDIKTINTTNFKTSKFDGLIAVYDLYGGKTKGFIFEKGKLVKRLKPNEAFFASDGKTPLPTRSQTCVLLSYACECGQVCVGGNCGCMQCNTCSVYVCWEDDGGGDDGGGNDDDGCNDCSCSPDLCSDDGDDSPADPCSGPNPPADCDPCQGNNKPAWCSCMCTNQAKSVNGIGRTSFYDILIGEVASVSFKVNFYVSDCSSPSYSTNVVPHVSNALGANIAPDPSVQESDEEYISFPFNGRNVKCGYNVGREISGMWRCTIRKKVNIGGFEMEIDLDQTQTYDDVTRIVHLN